MIGLYPQSRVHSLEGGLIAANSSDLLEDSTGLGSHVILYVMGERVCWNNYNWHLRYYPEPMLPMDNLAVTLNLPA